MLTIESRKVSLLKGITWRIIGTLDTIFLSWFFTGDISKALKIGGIELVTKIFLYYIHERAWSLSKKGKKEIVTVSGSKVAEDKHSRSVIKGISWRIVGTIDTILIAFFVTGNYSRAFEIGFTEVFTKMILFYFHERVWLRLTRVN
ncbi:MAG TPA: DUF2061 domain-containing protein [Ignavibacteria bacterium]|nr:DUF2061 domain-containing protein [Ignavibacteria bacterium]